MTDSPKVTLGGKEYLVPPMVPKQLRHVVPAMMRLGKMNVKETGLITEENITDAFILIFWGAIWPNDKTMTFDKAEETLNIPFPEMSVAMATIRTQTGMTTKAPEGATPGELKDEAAPSP